MQVTSICEKSSATKREGEGRVTEEERTRWVHNVFIDFWTLPWTLKGYCASEKVWLVTRQGYLVIKRKERVA